MRKRLCFSCRLPVFFILGACMPLCFAPFTYGFLAPLILACWLFFSRNLLCWQSTVSGFVFGMGMFCVGLWWVRISIHQFGGAPLAVAIFMVILLSTYLSLYYAVLGYFIQRIQVTNPVRYGVLFPVLATLLEVLRANLFTGFPWLAQGYVLVDLPFAGWLFPVMGALVASFWVYITAGLIVLILLACQGIGSLWRIFQPILILLTAVSLVMLGIHFVKNERITAFGRTVSVALLQGNVAQDEKFNYELFQRSINGYLELVSDSLQESQVIIWPETAIPSFYNDQAELLSELRAISKNATVDMLIGMPRESRGHQFNSLVFIGQNVEEDQFYDKYRLLPFGEYIPLRSLIGKIYDLIDIPMTGFSKGARKQSPFLFHTVEAMATGSICFEAVFGEIMRYQAHQSQFLINVSNDAWFGDSLAPWQHLQMVRARSIELGRPIIRATNTGITAFINEKGVVSKQAPMFVPFALKGTIQPTEGLTAYAVLGDYPWVMLFMVILIVALVYGYRHRHIDCP